MIYLYSKNLTLLIFFLFLSISVQAQDVNCDRNLGGTERDFLNSITKVPSGYVTVGNTSSQQGDFIGASPQGEPVGWWGASDAILAYFDSDCQTFAKKRHGGSMDDNFRDVIYNHEGQVVAVGWSNSGTNDLTTSTIDGINGWMAVFDIDESDINITENYIFGGDEDDNIYSISQTSDNGYILAGSSSSSSIPGGDDDSKDAYIVKLNANKAIIWQKRFGSSGEDIAYSAIETSDGGIMFVGIASAGDGDVGATHYGDYDLWIVKLDANGNQTGVSKLYGGTANDVGYSIVPVTEGGGYLIGGYSLSNTGVNNGAFTNSGDNRRPRGGRDMWLLRIDENANLDWYRRFGGTGNEGAQEIIAAGTNVYTVVGYSNTVLGDVGGDYTFPENGEGSRDAWVLTIDGEGEALGGSMFGSPDYDMAVAGVRDGNSIIAVGGLGGIGGDFMGGGTFTGGEFDALIFSTSYDVVPVENLIEPSAYSIHPNPISSDNSLTIDFKNSEYSGDVTVSFYNSMGQLMLSKKSQIENRKVIFPDISLLHPGNYFLKVSHKEFSATDKIVILR